jgi:hypothetical protein
MALISRAEKGLQKPEVCALFECLLPNNTINFQLKHFMMPPKMAEYPNGIEF